MTRLVRLGHWRSEREPDLPDPADLVDVSWGDDERFVVVQYLAAGTIVRTFMGYSPCRLCGERNGSSEYTDGRYVWPEGLVHYLDVHHVRLPAEVVEHIVDRFERLTGAEVDEDWWLRATIARPGTKS